MFFLSFLWCQLCRVITPHAGGRGPGLPVPPRSLEPTDRAECFLTLGSAPFGVRGTDAEQTLHSRCVDVEASGRRYTVIKNSVIACGLFPPRSLLLLFSFFSLLKRHHSFCSCPLFSIWEKKHSAFVVVCSLFSVTSAPPSAVKCRSDCVCLTTGLHSQLSSADSAHRPVGLDASTLCVPPSFYQFHFRI